MPELPEVTTTVNGLQKVLPGLIFSDVWTDLAKKNQKFKPFLNTIKNEKFYKKFKKEIRGKKILKVERRAKNILIHLSGNRTILIHLKMTGHLLFNVPSSKYIHVIFSFTNGKKLYFSDARKFGKVTIFPTDKMDETLHLKNIGPEPLEKNFTFETFKGRLFKKSASGRRKINTVLLDQSVIAGIGNIYSDEILWESSVHPESRIENIPVSFLKKMYQAMKDVLKKGIHFGGDSTSDYRNIHGGKGHFQKKHNVYQKSKEECGKKSCLGVIMRKMIGGRSAHFCPQHQKLF